MSHAGRVRQVTKAECVAVLESSGRSNKEKVYCIRVTWSDDTSTLKEVPQSSVNEFRHRLKTECYPNRNDISLPDVPNTNRLEFVAALKSDDKRKKAMQDFLDQILKLPDAVNKARLVHQFFANPNESNARESAPVVYAEVVINSSAPKSEPLNDFEPVVYAELQGSNSFAVEANHSSSPAVYTEVIKKTSSKTDQGRAKAKKVRPPVTTNIVEKAKQGRLEGIQTISSATGLKRTVLSATNGQSAFVTDQLEDPLYTEVPPSSSSHVSRPEVRCESTRPHHKSKETELLGAGDDDADTVDGGDDSPNDAFYINVTPSQSNRFYENMNISSKIEAKSAEKNFYKVVHDYIPNTTHSQGLRVRAGDIVQVDSVSGGRAFCLLCVKYPATDSQPFEGWIPLEVMKPCRPDIVESSSSSVPVYRAVDDECPSSSSSEAAATAKAGAKKIAPEAVPKAAHRPPPLTLGNKPGADTKASNGKHVTDVKSYTNCELIADSYLLNFENGALCSPIPDGFSPQLTVPSSKQMTSHILRSASRFKSSSSSVAIGVHVIAIADYKPPTSAGSLSSTSSSVFLPFNSGDVAELVYTTQSRWWCVFIGTVNGWVPADYWRILSDDGRFGSDESAPWMAGFLGREECEELIMKHGNEGSFVIRHSKNLSGQYALSMKHKDRLHHFPIVPTEDKKFYIGKHHFATIENVVIYYSKNTLFIDDCSQSVKLGKPLSTPNRPSS